MEWNGMENNKIQNKKKKAGTASWNSMERKYGTRRKRLEWNGMEKQQNTEQEELSDDSVSKFTSLVRARD